MLNVYSKCINTIKYPFNQVDIRKCTIRHLVNPICKYLTSATFQEFVLEIKLLNLFEDFLRHHQSPNCRLPLLVRHLIHLASFLHPANQILHHLLLIIVIAAALCIFAFLIKLLLLPLLLVSIVSLPLMIIELLNLLLRYLCRVILLLLHSSRGLLFLDHLFRLPLCLFHRLVLNLDINWFSLISSLLNFLWDHVLATADSLRFNLILIFDQLFCLLLLFSLNLLYLLL